MKEQIIVIVLHFVVVSNLLPYICLSISLLMYSHTSYIVHVCVFESEIFLGNGKSGNTICRIRETDILS